MDIVIKAVMIYVMAMEIDMIVHMIKINIVL